VTVFDEFSDLMTDTVTVEAKTGQDGYGKRTYAAPVSYSCRVQRKRKQIRAFDGRVLVADGKVIILGNPTVGPEDRLTIGVEVENILAVEDFHDERGPHHIDVYFGAG
jgi:hypothetical protein